jgi:proton-coupled amino acid transporter
MTHPLLPQVVDEYHEPKLDVRLYMVMLLLPLIIINWVRNLKLLAPFSMLANFLMFIGFGITLYYILVDIPNISTRNPVGVLRDVPLFFGMVLFALEAIGVVSLAGLYRVFETLYRVWHKITVTYPRK